jgi:hypothetical protein
MDPLSAGVALINGLIRTHKINEWCKLAATMLFAFWVSFAAAAGADLLLSTKTILPSVAAISAMVHALGVGLSSGAASCGWLWMRSDLTKKIMTAVPKDLNVNTQEVIGIEHK